jgi:hypothetical protein
MRLDSHSARTIQYCKLKRVYLRLPLHVHSAETKGFTGRGSGNPFRSETPATAAVRACESTSDRPRMRLENEPSPEPWSGPESVACGRGRGHKDLLLVTRREAS